jgi:hypothetical protein
MLVRSPRRFIIVSFIAFIFIFGVLQNSPWAQETRLYEQLPPLFKSGGSKGNLSENVELGSEELQAHLDDAWQHAIPVPNAIPLPSAHLVGTGNKGGEDAKRPEASGTLVDAQQNAEEAGKHEAAAPIIVSGGNEKTTASAARINPTPGGLAHPTPTGPHPPWVTDPSRTRPIAPKWSRPANMKAYMQKMLKWARPTWDGHWPPFADYVDKKYDPNRWEEFKM